MVAITGLHHRRAVRNVSDGAGVGESSVKTRLPIITEPIAKEITL